MMENSLSEKSKMEDHLKADQSDQSDHSDDKASIILESRNANVYYGDMHAIKDVSIKMLENTVTAFIGPSGCGKSTFLRTFNRMNDYIDVFRKEGEFYINGKEIYSKDVRVEALRKTVGMVFQKPNPFPKTIYENVAFGLRIQGIDNKSVLDEVVERSLRQAAIWDEVKDNLKKSALALSGGQQQRVCIARALAVEPKVLLMDEPASALDPISTAKIEELIFQLKENYTIVIVTHNMQQAGRVSDKTAFFYIGELIEYGKTKNIFTHPKKELTERYITGRFG
jgi:phosphate transport system ATP-binding protein